MDKHASHHSHVNRVEDRAPHHRPRQIRRRLERAGQLYAHFVRADRAHAEIVSVNTAQALAQPGVKLILTGEDAVRAGYTKAPHALTFPGRNGMKARAPARPALAHGQGALRRRGGGDGGRHQRRRRAGRRRTRCGRIQRSAGVPLSEDALAAGAPQLHDDVPGNLAFESETGDAKAVDAAFAKAAHVTRVKVESTRVSPSPMEPRACLVAYDATSETYRFNVCNQGTTTLRKQMSAYTKVPEDKLVFELRDVGGGFGQRTVAYPEYCALMMAAKATGKPVKWVSTRVEGFLTDTHGRSNIIDGALALDRDGKFLAMRLDWINDMGAYLSPGAMGHIRNTTTCMTGVYRIPALYGSYRVALTNTTPIGSYRGAGRPDIAYAVERLVNEAAAELGIDPAELRRRNFIPLAAFPYKTPTGSTYEIADMPGMLDKALKLADWQRLRQAPRAIGGGGKAARHRHLDRDRKHRRRQRADRRSRNRRSTRQARHRAHRGQSAGPRPRNDVRDDRRQRARPAARAGEASCSACRARRCRATTPAARAAPSAPAASAISPRKS